MLVINLSDIRISVKYTFKTLVVFSSIVVSRHSSAQNITTQSLVWFNYTIHKNFSKNYFLVTEFSERIFSNPIKQHQFLIRTHFHRNINSFMDFAPGFTYFLQSPHDPDSKSKLVVPEIRPHLEINAKHHATNMNLHIRYRAEYRMFKKVENDKIVEGFNTNFRFRIMTGLDYVIYRLKNDKNLKIKLQDEIHFNAGKSIVYNVFDQNRIYMGLGLDLSKTTSFEAGYLNWYQQRPSGIDFYNRHIVRFQVTQKW